jgi:hypothetical protein
MPVDATHATPRCDICHDSCALPSVSINRDTVKLYRIQYIFFQYVAEPLGINRLDEGIFRVQARGDKCWHEGQG